MSDTPRSDERWEFLHRMGWEREQMPVEAIMESHEQLERELEQERALADRLASALTDSATWSHALPAYQAWKEARDESHEARPVL